MPEFALIVGLAVLAANLPFLVERRFLILRAASKPFWIRLTEWFGLYLLLAVMAYMLESRLSPVHSQHWQFYVSTFAIYTVFSWPGFVWQYFWKNKPV